MRNSGMASDLARGTDSVRGFEEVHIIKFTKDLADRVIIIAQS